MRRTIFDLEVLRTFSTGMELGNFAKAAERLGRSTSAVSAQLKKLEEQAGTPIFRKVGRGLALTDAGETMLGYARRLLELNDEAAAAVHSVELEGWVRLGLQEDFGETLLPDVLGRFARAHPKVRIEARVVRNAELLERVTSGKLDLALAWSDGTLTAHCERIGEVPMRWIGPSEGPPGWQAASGEPMPSLRWKRHACCAARRPRRWMRRAFPGGSPSSVRASAVSGPRRRQASVLPSARRSACRRRSGRSRRGRSACLICRRSAWSCIGRKPNRNRLRRGLPNSCFSRCRARCMGWWPDIPALTVRTRGCSFRPL
ncbi:LysR family transcriptional regulator [Rhizobium ruizarguesonis]|nr:LysR family transcriptional regulator [Rhizobium ruizarguesonis]